MKNQQIKSDKKNIKFYSLTNSPLLRHKYRKCTLLKKKQLKKLYQNPASSGKSINSISKTVELKEGHVRSVNNNRVNSLKNCNIPFSISCVDDSQKFIGLQVTKNEDNLCKQKSHLNEKSCIFKMSTNRNVGRPNILESYISESRLNDSAQVTSLISLMSTESDVAPSFIRNKPNNGFNSNESVRLGVSRHLSNEDKGSKKNLNIDEWGITTQRNFTNIGLPSFQNKPSRNECFIPINSVYTMNNTCGFYELSGYRFLVLMLPESYLSWIGILELELLNRSVEILGYTLNRLHKRFMLYSLQGSSHLYLKTVHKPHDNSESASNISLEKLLSLGLSEKISRQVMKETKGIPVTFLIIRRNTSHVSSSVWPMFFDNHLSFYIFPPNDMLSQKTRLFHNIECRIHCVFEENLKKLGFKEFTQIQNWSVIEKDLLYQGFHKTVLCGGKSVGKSTLLRYFINKSLQKWDRVLVIDFDIGQCEFTIAGCISVTMVEEPLLGPNYSHLQEPLRTVFLGEIDVTKCPESYIEGCKQLINYAYEEHSSIPWFINTMGFTKGFGVTLTCGIIKNLSPTHVIQIESKNRKLNFPSNLTPGFVYSQNVGVFQLRKNSLDYKLYTIPSAAECQGSSNMSYSRGISPPEARNLVLLSYLSGMLSSEILNLSQVIPYMINMDLLDLQTVDNYSLTKIQVAAAMNGNLVALCFSKDGDVFPNCIGFGIVRGIDWQASTLFLITPVQGHSLSKVNCLIKGNIALPESLYYNQGGLVVNHIPYMARTSGRAISRFARRDFRTLPTKDDSK